MTANEELLLGLVEAGRGLPARTRKLATTFLLLASPIEYTRLIARLGEEIRQGRQAVDDAWLRTTYRALPRRQRIQLAASFAASAAGPETFQDLFEDARLRCRPTAEERASLARAFSRFFDLHPNQAAANLARGIRLLLHSRESTERLHGLLGVEHLGSLHEDDLRVLLASARSRSAGVRSNAWLALARLAARGGVLTPDTVSALSNQARALAADSQERAGKHAALFLKLTSSRPPTRRRRG